MPVGPDEYKDALRRFGSGLTVITVAAGDELHGMTASSFASVSLDPPLVLVCLENDSRTHALVLETRAFAANVLAEEMEPIARAFSQRGHKPFERLPIRFGATGAPLIEGAIAWIESRVDKVIEGGDHDVVIGEVVACQSAPGNPLLYWDRNYRRLGSR